MAKLDYGTVGRHGLSYSRLSDFHKCPRKFELSHVLSLSERKNSVTFAYGHSVAEGVQSYLTYRDKHKAIIAAAAAYDFDWLDAGTFKEQRAKKNIWYALNAVEKLINGLQHHIHGNLALLAEYDVLWFDFKGKSIPAVELQFRIELDYDYVYEGHIDLVLVHKKTGKWVVLELKTTSLNDPHDALYIHSDQALSYSVVLDKIVETFGATDTVPDYAVIYGIYSSSAQDWIIKRFAKSVTQRFSWINNLLRDVELIESYYEDSKDGIAYPTRGGSCFEFFYPCEHLDRCGYSNETLKRLVKVKDTQFEVEDNTHFVFNIEDIIIKQQALASKRSGIKVTIPSEI